MTRFLHTSDWHLGSTLFGQSRLGHSQAMLDGLRDLIVRDRVDCLLVSGDIFDSPNPPVAAQDQYFSFLDSLQGTSCTQVVAISGNHDSASLLAAPRALLSRLGIQVAGRAGQDGEIIPAGDDAVVLAVPFIHDGDLGPRLAGTSLEERQQEYREEVRAHIRSLVDQAGKDFPGRTILAMAHAFLTGSAMSGGKDEPHYVGNLGSLPADIFPPEIRYVALGHIHRPQQVRAAMPMRYSGSPYPIDYGEADERKEVVEIDVTSGGKPVVRAVPLSAFCRLASIEGDLPALKERLRELAATGEETWVEAAYTGTTLPTALRKELAAACENTSIVLQNVVDKGGLERASRAGAEDVVDLTTLTPRQVFRMKLDEQRLDDGEKTVLQELFDQVLREVEA